MIGHPSETLEDVQAIADLCKRVIDEGRKVASWKIKLHAGVGTFVPKPQTPFQWVAVDTRESIVAKQALLKRELRDPNIKLSWTDPDDTLLEAWLSRGDRRMAEVIYSAWRKGAKFDAWNDEHKAGMWAAGLRRARTGSRPSTPIASAGRTRSSRGITSRPRCARTSCSRISASRWKARSVWIAG